MSQIAMFKSVLNVRIYKNMSEYQNMEYKQSYICTTGSHFPIWH